MRTGETIRNNQTGESLTMLVSDEDNGGTRQLYRVHLPARRPSPPLHYHVAFTETFSVVEGTLDLYVGRERQHVRLKPHESLTVQIGQAHTFANESDSPSVMTVEAKPAGGVVRAFQLAYGVANDGGAAKDGLPKNPIVRLVFIGMSGGFLPQIPLALQKMLFGLAASIAAVTGVQRGLSRYL